MNLSVLIHMFADTDPVTGLPIVSTNQATVTSALQVVFAIIGAVAVIVVIIAGFNFVTAQGDPQAIAKARQTIIYAAVGLIIAISAEIIVTFVLNRL
jgi:hypothetical protein